MRILVLLAVIVEAALLLAGGAYALHRVRERRRTHDGREETVAAEEGIGERPQRALAGVEKVLTWGVPLSVARFLILEPRLWWCLGIWATRRGPKGPDVFAYHKRSPMGAMLVVVFLTTPVEILLFELLIPVFWIRVLLLVAAVYALFFVLALYASMIVMPHRVTAGACSCAMERWPRSGCHSSTSSTRRPSVERGREVHSAFPARDSRWWATRRCS